MGVVSLSNLLQDDLANLVKRKGRPRDKGGRRYKPISFMGRPMPDAKHRGAIPENMLLTHFLKILGSYKTR